MEYLTLPLMVKQYYIATKKTQQTWLKRDQCSFRINVKEYRRGQSKMDNPERRLFTSLIGSHIV
jgi:hypothetical protein